MKAEIVSIGTELLLGAIHDTNATYIAQELNKIGVDVLYRTTVGDNEQRIAEVINNALNRVDVVITSGGLGPTQDDVTREAIGRATNRPVEFQQDLYEYIEAYFKSRGYTFSENNARQAYIPQGAQKIINPVGTAPVFILETERGAVMVLPGVPREMKYLLEHTMIPWIKENMGEQAVIVYRVLRTAGIGESQLDNLLGDLMQGDNPTVGLAAHVGQADIRITAKAATEEAALVLIKPVEKLIREKLGYQIYGTGSDTTESVTLGMLSKQGKTVATVEHGTGGIVDQRIGALTEDLQRVALQRDILAELPELNASSLEQIAEDQARRLRENSSVTYGLSFIMRRKNDSKTHAAISIATADTSEVRIYDWDFERDDVAEWISTHLFAWLRRKVLEETGVAFDAQ